VCTNWQWTTDNLAVLDVAPRRDTGAACGGGGGGGVMGSVVGGGNVVIGMGNTADGGFAGELRAYAPPSTEPIPVTVTVTATCAMAAAAAAPVSVRGSVVVWVQAAVVASPTTTLITTTDDAHDSHYDSASFGCASCRWLLPPRHTTAVGVLPPPPAGSHYRVLAGQGHSTLVEADAHGRIVTGNATGTGCIVAPAGAAAAYAGDERLLRCVHVAEVASLRLAALADRDDRCGGKWTQAHADGVGSVITAAGATASVSLAKGDDAATAVLCVSAWSAAGERFGALPFVGV